MLTLKQSSILFLALSLGACVPLSKVKEQQRQNSAALQEVKEKNQELAEGQEALADKTVDLALKNHRLKLDNEALQKEARERESFYDSVTYDLRQQVLDGQLKVTRHDHSLDLDVSDELLFDSAKADLKTEGKKVLRVVGKAVSRGDRGIHVVGHTDDQPLAKGAAYASNWELSTARATTVVRFLQEQSGLDPRRLLAAGRAEWMPVASNATAEGRRKNRRTTITLVDREILDAAAPR
jgi:chemotaxis protein MotB